jgi:4-hydroxy-2-oxoheptanedioate aldolase
MYPNPLKQKLQNGELVLGTSLPAPSPVVAGVVCGSGVDFIWIDTEHASWASESLEGVPVLIRQRGIAPMIRVAESNGALIKKACDIGAVAIMVPQISDAEEAARAVSYVKYPPEGERGLSPMWTVAAGEDWNHVIKTANDEIVVVLQLETQAGFDNLDQIKKVPGIDVILVGPLDLSASVGRITDTNSKEVQAIMEEVPRRLEGTGIVTGTTLGGLDELREKIGWGYRFLNMGNPVSYGAQVVRDHIQALRG